ncbi:MAG: DUF3224 domain-containing protein [Terracidiphilus sp.]
MNHRSILFRNHRTRYCTCVLVSFSLALCLAFSTHAQTQSPPSKLLRKDPVMTRHAEGTFDVKMTPLPADDATTGTSIGRYALDKQFHGDIEGASKGEMLSAGDPSKGSAGYVAIEHITGTLHGHTGSFALQHNGSMNQGTFLLEVTVVPGTGTGELTGISGTMKIIISAGKHSYTFDYTLPESVN